MLTTAVSGRSEVVVVPDLTQPAPHAGARDLLLEPVHRRARHHDREPRAAVDPATTCGSSLSGLQWVIDAYTLVLASLLMLGGSTGDRIGRRRTFQTGLALFGVGSLLCSLAPDHRLA